MLDALLQMILTTWEVQVSEKGMEKCMEKGAGLRLNIPPL